jgi:hypothetical protein
MPKNSPSSSTRAAVLRARSAAFPPLRSMGIIPMAGKMYLVFQESMYSALPTKVMRRGSTRGRKKESMTDVWLGQKIAPPTAGRRSRPTVLIRHSPLNTGERTAFATG